MVKEKNAPKERMSNGAVQEEFTHGLKHLRGLVREAGEHFILSREGEIETVISHFAAIPPGKLKTEASNWLHQIRSLKLKPAEGRIKDLKGIAEFIEKLAEQVISAQERHECRRKVKG